MCVIIAQPKEAYLSREVAEAAWKRNPDGGSFSYIDPETERVVVFKYMNFREFWGHFERTRSQNRDRDFLIHMRIATHGSVCLANVHPFVVDEHTVMAHNGMIHSMPNTDPEGRDRTDSQMFVDYVLKDLPEDWLDNRYLKNMVEDHIGWSRLAFLTTNPKLKYPFYILNEDKGETFRGMWFSNDQSLKQFKQPAYKAVTPLNTGKKYAPKPGEREKAWQQAKKDWEDRQQKLNQTQTLTPAVKENDHDWLADPLESGITQEEADARWRDIVLEMADMQDQREETFHIPHKLTWHALGGGIYCTKCQEQAELTTGYCSCWDMADAVCKQALALCTCSIPKRVGFDGLFVDEESEVIA